MSCRTVAKSCFTTTSSWLQTDADAQPSRDLRGTAEAPVGNCRIYVTMMAQLAYHRPSRRPQRRTDATFSSDPRLVDDSINETTMSDLEDNNPFQTEADEAHSETASNVDISEPATPPAHPSRILSPPATPSMNRNFVRPAPAYKAPQTSPKSEFCCMRDRWLHSGEDVEIQARLPHERIPCLLKDV